MLLTDDALESARTALEQLHTTTAQHQTLTETTSATGSTTQSWTTAGNVACRVETDMGDTSGRLTEGTPPADRNVYEYMVFAAHDAAIEAGDRLVLPSGITLSVQVATRGQSQAFVSAYACTEVA